MLYIVNNTIISFQFGLYAFIVGSICLKGADCGILGVDECTSRKSKDDKAYFRKNY